MITITAFDMVTGRWAHDIITIRKVTQLSDFWISIY